MTIIVFLIDTSASMNQRTFIGARPTMLDIAKGAVETFVKVSTLFTHTLGASWWACGGAAAQGTPATT